MWLSFAIPFIQLIMKILPFLYQLKLIRTEAELKELQRRFQDAIRKAESGATDSSDLKKQHEENRKDLEDKYDTVWGSSNQSPEPVEPDKDDSSTPDQQNAPRIEAPDRVEVSKDFLISLYGLPQNGVILYADRFKILEVGIARENILLRLNSKGERTLQAKVGETVFASKKLIVE